MTDRELMQQALEALELVADLTNHDDEVYAAIDALRERLAQPEQEPVAWRNKETGEFCTGGFLRKDWARWTPLYTTPPRREWVGLTDDDLKPVCDEYRILFGGWVHDFARAIEAKLREKNA